VIMRKVTIGDCILYKGDAMKIMPELYGAGEQVDCIVADPPYELTSGGCTEGGLHERFGKNTHGYGNNGKIVLCDIDWSDFMLELYNLLKHGHAYVMANNRNVQPMLNAAENAEFYFHNLLIWDKITATPNRWYMKNLEFIGFFSKGKAININNCSSKQLIKCPQIDESIHPTEKPVSLMEHYILNSTKPNMLVADPFMGSGSTGVAAVRAGRRFVGIEEDEQYFDIAVERITKAVSEFQHSLF